MTKKKQPAASATPDPPDQLLERFTRWAKLVSQLRQVRHDIEIAGTNGHLDGVDVPNVKECLDCALDQLLDAMPTAGVE